eukprot:5654053-Alexandrium_andersonii.AAC.1
MGVDWWVRARVLGRVRRRWVRGRAEQGGLGHSYGMLQRLSFLTCACMRPPPLRQATVDSVGNVGNVLFDNEDGGPDGGGIDLDSDLDLEAALDEAMDDVNFEAGPSLFLASK